MVCADVQPVSRPKRPVSSRAVFTQQFLRFACQGLLRATFSFAVDWEGSRSNRGEAVSKLCWESKQPQRWDLYGWRACLPVLRPPRYLPTCCGDLATMSQASGGSEVWTLCQWRSGKCLQVSVWTWVQSPNLGGSFHWSYWLLAIQGRMFPSTFHSLSQTSGHLYLSLSASGLLTCHNCLPGLSLTAGLRQVKFSLSFF